jgi:hypothetical protein
LLRHEQATGGWSTKILGFIAVWKLLNLSFLATPLGMILTGLLAIIALYDDFKVWQAGGQSLLNWGKTWVRVLALIVAGIAAIPSVLALASGAMSAWVAIVEIASSVMAVLNTIMAAFRYVMIAVNLAMYANPVGVMVAGFLALIGVIGLVIYKWSALKSFFETFFAWVADKLSVFSGAVSGLFSGGIGGALPKVGDAITGIFGKGGAASAIGSAINPSPLVGPNAGTQQKISQETNINVQGSADANATGKAVANEQSKVNFDMTRNLKGATR